MTKNVLFDKIWQNTVVTEGILTHYIEEIRKALSDDASNSRFLKTVPWMGYKIIARVDNFQPER
ncbi:winged helix-turn-helix domain-containing protein [candidate division KSB1 bacterium]|nr:winged helix-turn-helix domain-containing protein [candidate division KSB1 bacterium]